MRSFLGFMKVLQRKSHIPHLHRMTIWPFKYSSDSEQFHEILCLEESTYISCAIAAHAPAASR